MVCVWLPGHGEREEEALGFPFSFSFVIRRSEARSSPIPAFLCAPPQSSDLRDWVVHLSFVRSFLTLVVLLA